MGTTYSIKLAGVRLAPDELADLQRRVEARLVALNRQMSHYQADSELSRFNQHTSATPFKVSAELATVTRLALQLNHVSGGAFDPTLGPLINLWGFGPGAAPPAPPSEDEIAQARRLTGCGQLVVTVADELQKRIPGLQLNLSAVAKGFGVDEVARVLRAAGLTNYFVEIGGEVATLGLNKDRHPWRVGIDRPAPGSLPGAAVAGVVHLSGLAIATSGDYRNFFRDAAGHAYTHILDPATGRPVERPLSSVSVVAADCATADGLATALYVLGPAAGLRCLTNYSGAEALFLIHQPEHDAFQEIASPGFERLTGYERWPAAAQ